MGGPGSGMWLRWDKKNTVEGHQCLDIRELRREHEITPGDSITAQYDWRGEQVSQEIFLDWTTCNYGGFRPWFVCMACGRRVAKIYLGAKKFACRHCHDLTYMSCQESDSRFKKFFQNYDGLGGVEDIPFYALKGYLSRTWKLKKRFRKELTRRRRGRPQKLAQGPKETSIPQNNTETKT
jgi:hypothetical protein